jgi:hypothetical protein
MLNAGKNTVSPKPRAKASPRPCRLLCQALGAFPFPMPRARFAWAIFLSPSPLMVLLPICGCELGLHRRKSPLVVIDAKHDVSAAFFASTGTVWFSWGHALCSPPQAATGGFTNAISRPAASLSSAAIASASCWPPLADGQRVAACDCSPRLFADALLGVESPARDVPSGVSAAGDLTHVVVNLNDGWRCVALAKAADDGKTATFSR